MCGIAGIINLKKPIDLNTLLSMNNIVKYRGPDDEGYFLSDGRKNNINAYGDDTVKDIKEHSKYIDISEICSEEHSIALSHRRLSILDLSSDGHQPMCDKDQEVHIVFNGEIYNYIELRNELRDIGYVFSTDTDTEVLLNAYIEWGEACVKRFNGMWSFAIWDSKKKKLFCSRDRLGVKPFYYYLTKDKFVFGSEMKQIIQDQTISRSMNEEALAASLVFGLSDYDDNTLIENIKVLLGGYNLSIVIDSQISVLDAQFHRYWDLNSRSSLPCSDPNYTERVGKELEHSVLLRLRSDVPVGVLLSGGLDSSVLATLASGQLSKENKTMDTFTSCYPGSKKHDESYFAHLVNQHNKCNEHFITPDVENAGDDFEQIIWHIESITNFNILGTYNLLKKVKDSNVKVILNGQGGDETMFGYERYYAFYFKKLLKELKFKKLCQEFTNASKNSRLDVKMLLEYFVYFGIPFARNFYRKQVTGRYLKKEAYKNLNYKGIRNILYPKDLNELQYNELRNTQLTHILRLDDRLYMAFSLESRVPFVDYKFIELSAAIPAEYKISKGFTKYLIRDYMDTKMPKEVTWRTNKIGFSAPVERWIKKFDDDYIYKMINTSRSKKYFKIDKIREIYNKNPMSREFADYLSVELFMRLFDII